MFWRPFFQQCNVILLWYGCSLRWKYEGEGSRKGGLKRGVFLGTGLINMEIRRERIPGKVALNKGLPLVS